MCPNNEIRVIAPAQSYSNKRQSLVQYSRAETRLQALGYTVGYGRNVRDVLHFGTGGRQARADDFNEAYRDRNVGLVLALDGGWSSNEILPLIDWQAVRDNPKPLMGFSDISVLVNAVYAMTGNIGYLGPTFKRLGQMIGWRYTLAAADAIWRQDNRLVPRRSEQCGENGMQTRRTPPWRIFQPGQAEGVALGGNLGSLFLLPGTPYCPRFDQPFIWVMEDDDEDGKYAPMEVSRRFEAWLQQPGFRDNLAGLLVGRFQSGSKITRRDIESILRSKDLGNIPVMYDLDFGHTLPMFTLPVGGRVRVDTGTRDAIMILSDGERTQ